MMTLLSTMPAGHEHAWYDAWWVAIGGGAVLALAVMYLIMVMLDKKKN